MDAPRTCAAGCNNSHQHLLFYSEKDNTAWQAATAESPRRDEECYRMIVDESVCTEFRHGTECFASPADEKLANRRSYRRRLFKANTKRSDRVQLCFIDRVGLQRSKYEHEHDAVKAKPYTKQNILTLEYPARCWQDLSVTLAVGRVYHARKSVWATIRRHWSLRNSPGARAICQTMVVRQHHAICRALLKKKLICVGGTSQDITAESTKTPSARLSATTGTTAESRIHSRRWRKCTP